MNNLNELELSDYIDMTEYDFDGLAKIWGEYEVDGLPFVGKGDSYIDRTSQGKAYYMQRAYLDTRNLRLDQIDQVMDQYSKGKIEDKDRYRLDNHFTVEWHNQKDIDSSDSEEHMHWEDFMVRNDNFHEVY